MEGYQVWMKTGASSPNFPLTPPYTSAIFVSGKNGCWKNNLNNKSCFSYAFRTREDDWLHVAAAPHPACHCLTEEEFFFCTPPFFNERLGAFYLFRVASQRGRTDALRAWLCVGSPCQDVWEELHAVTAVTLVMSPGLGWDWGAASGKRMRLEWLINSITAHAQPRVSDCSRVCVIKVVQRMTLYHLQLIFRLYLWWMGIYICINGTNLFHKV